MVVNSKETSTENKFSINKELIKKYISELKEINPCLKDDTYLQLSMKMPEVIEKIKNELKEDEWSEIKNGILKAIQKLTEFRVKEGIELKKDLTKNINSIKKLSKEILLYEDERIKKIRNNLEERLNILNTEFNKDRLEQELIYYIEKFDINEEKVRLKSHLDYFLEELNNEDKVKGKKLNFISQEIGREINTLGSKANHSKLQKIVVEMKNNLEKIKEQNLNIL